MKVVSIPSAWLDLYRLALGREGMVGTVMPSELGEGFVDVEWHTAAKGALTSTLGKEVSEVEREIERAQDLIIFQAAQQSILDAFRTFHETGSLDADKFLHIVNQAVTDAVNSSNEFQFEHENLHKHKLQNLHRSGSIRLQKYVYALFNELINVAENNPAEISDKASVQTVNTIRSRLALSNFDANRNFHYGGSAEFGARSLSYDPPVRGRSNAFDPKLLPSAEELYVVTSPTCGWCKRFKEKYKSLVGEEPWKMRELIATKDVRVPVPSFYYKTKEGELYNVKNLWIREDGAKQLTVNQLQDYLKKGKFS